MAQRLQDIQRQILGSQEEELACRLRLDGMLGIVDDWSHDPNCFMSCDPAASVLPPQTALSGLEGMPVKNVEALLEMSVVVFLSSWDARCVFISFLNSLMVLWKEDISCNSLFSFPFFISVQLVKPFECFCLCIYEFLSFCFLHDVVYKMRICCSERCFINVWIWFCVSCFSGLGRIKLELNKYLSVLFFKHVFVSHNKYRIFYASVFDFLFHWVLPILETVDIASALLHSDVTPWSEVIFWSAFRRRLLEGYQKDPPLSPPGRFVIG